MKNSLPENLDFLLDANWVENFLNSNAKTIFNKSISVKVLEINRSKSYAPESFALSYKVAVGGKNTELRASASLKQSRENQYKILNQLLNNGFSFGKIRTCEPLGYFPEYNLMLYRAAAGEMLRDFLRENLNAIEAKIKLAAEGIRKIHSQDIKLDLKDRHWQFDVKRLLKYDPLIEPILKQVGAAQESINTKRVFCHGDYQVENIIVGEHLTIIDFGSATFAPPEYDLACFIRQLEIMLKRYGDPARFHLLSDIFLNNCGDFDKKVLKSFSLLFDLEIFQALIAIYEEDPTTNKTQIFGAIEFWKNKIQENHCI